LRRLWLLCVLHLHVPLLLLHPRALLLPLLLCCWLLL
jgi:hypothetical protein